MEGIQNLLELAVLKCTVSITLLPLAACLLLLDKGDEVIDNALLGWVAMPMHLIPGRQAINHEE